MSSRILLDRSIFHGERFDQLASSNLRELVKGREIQVYFTPAFVEETLRYGFSGDGRFPAQWGFLESLVGQKWFKFSKEIIAVELGDRIRSARYYLQPKSRVRTTYRNTEASVWKQLPAEELQNALDKVAQHREQDIEFRKSRVELREGARFSFDLFHQFVEQHCEWVIQNLFMKEEPNSANFLKTWRTKRGRCPFTEQLLKASLATIFLAGADHQLRLDVNDGSDSDQLAFLIWADVMVSDDTRFMKGGFDLLYGNSTKQLMTLMQFIDFMNQVSTRNKRT